MYQDNLTDSYYSTASHKAEAQELAVRLGSLCRVYEQTDRVLTQDPINVHVVDDGPAPAWSDGKDIYINKEEIKEFDLEELVQINGLNYHELAHHLYSPRKGTTMMQWVMQNEAVDPGYLAATNVLEDQRIETLLTARYPAIVPYLTKTILRWITDTPEKLTTNYVAIRGRQYLPLDLRIALRDMFFMPELIPVAASIIDEYRTLHFPKQYERAQELIERFKLEVLDKMGVINPPDGGPSGCGGRNPSALGRPEPGKAQQKDSERAKGMGQPEPQFVPKPAEDNTSEPGSSAGSESGEDEGTTPSAESSSNNGSSNGEGTGTFTPPKTASEALAQRKVDQDFGNQSNTGHADSLGGIPDNIADIMTKIEETILTRKDVQQDIKTKQRVIIGGDGKHDDNVKRGKYDLVPVLGSVLAAARRFGRELERLKQECEPIWQRETPTGRVNVQRVINGCEIDVAFDRWQEGTDGTDIETVMLIDRSGSMASDHNDMRASEAAYIIKRAMEQIDCPVTVYSFDDRAELVSERSEKVNKVGLPFIYGNGGTNPRTTLIAAERLLKSSRAKSKILFLITDGQFNHGDNDEIIDRLNSMGVITVMVLIADDAEVEWLQNRYQSSDEDMWHKCSIHGLVKSASDLVPFAKEIVTGTIKRSLRK